MISSTRDPNNDVMLVSKGLMIVGTGLMVPWLYEKTPPRRPGTQRWTGLNVRKEADFSAGPSFLDGVVQEVFDTDEPLDGVMKKGDLEIEISNAYTRVAPLATGEEYTYPWPYVAEPFRPTRLETTEEVKWIVDGHVQGYGSSVEVLWTSTGWKQVVAVNGEKTTGVWVMVKYVRRELRSLTDRDREMLFQAFMIMQRVPTTVGRKIFGRHYRSKDYLTRMHVYFGGTQDCDHWHQGAGFVTSHVAFTLEFERSLQSLYPAAVVPYWDITLESTFYHPDTWRESMVFARDWFGDASPDNDLHTMTQGRWAWTPAYIDKANFSDVHNSYGILRAPWNNDPTPFLTRSSEIYGIPNNMKPSGCKEYAIAVRKTNWMALSRQLNSAAHGHIHETVGGSWNNPDFFSSNEDVSEDDVMNDDDANVLLFAHEIQALSKELWRGGYVQCPSTCDMAVPWSSCLCQCPTSVMDGTTPSYDILDSAGVLSAVDYYDASDQLIDSWLTPNGTIYYTLPGYTADESQRIYDRLLDILCEPGHIGDMFQASSPNDLTFWVLHPTVDRLWHFSRLGADASFDHTWYPYHSCHGHNPDDVTPFADTDLVLDPSSSSDPRSFYSNADLYDLFDPASDSLPYMYDHFKWPHCDLIGHYIQNH